MAKLLKVTSNGRSYYVEKLKKGEIVGVAVGGVEEACFDFDYNTEWGSRTGFANVALEAGKEIKLNLTSSIKGQSSSVPLHKSLYEILKNMASVAAYSCFDLFKGTFYLRATAL